MEYFFSRFKNIFSPPLSFLRLSPRWKSANARECFRNFAQARRDLKIQIGESRLNRFYKLSIGDASGAKK